METARYTYTIIVSGENFTFTRDQIESDPGNQFEFHFGLGAYENPQAIRVLTIEKDVQLFKLIQAHLRGYEIFPLADAAIPSRMTRELAMANLLHDAQLYQIEKLQSRMKAFQSEIQHPTQPLSEVPARRRYKFADWSKNGWYTHDITEEGYQTYLSRVLNSTGLRPMPVSQLSVPGYTLSVAWQDYPVGMRDYEGNCTDAFSVCALFVSNPWTNEQRHYQQLNAARSPRGHY